jgi:hypothetical protein
VRHQLHGQVDAPILQRSLHGDQAVCMRSAQLQQRCVRHLTSPVISLKKYACSAAPEAVSVMKLISISLEIRPGSVRG